MQSKTKTNVNIKIVFSIILVLLCIAFITGCSSSNDNAESSTANNTTASSNDNESHDLEHQYIDEPLDTYTVPYGEITQLYEDYNENLYVVVDVDSSVTEDENYDNVYSLIEQGAGDSGYYIYYTAENNGKTVISFTVNKQIINAISEGNLPEDTLQTYLEDYESTY